MGGDRDDDLGGTMEGHREEQRGEGHDGALGVADAHDTCLNLLQHEDIHLQSPPP